MKIAILRKDYNPRGGGAEVYAANMSSALVQRGHEVTVFSETFLGETNKDIRNVEVRKSLLSGFSRTSAFHRRVQRNLKKLRIDFDLVFALSRTWPSDVFRVTESLHAEWMKIRYGKLGKLNPRHRGILKLERDIFKSDNTKLVVTNSELTKRQAVKNFGFPEDRITVVYNGVDHAKFRPVENRNEFFEIRKRLNLDDRKFVLLFPATNFKIKGLANAIRTLSLLDEDLRKRTLLLVAGGDREAPYRNLAEKLKVSGNIRFEGRKGDMRDYYAAADLLFYPTLYEPFSNVCLEAFSCGLPVLTTALNGAAEIVTENLNGFTVPDASAEEMMAGQIAKFAGFSEPERVKFSGNAYNASLNFSWTKHVEQLEKVFYRLRG
jgi:UDP-glucose:(heptosyl)LPS alpha-1,3-glucosyltransferase